MSPIVARRTAVTALYEHCRTVTLTSTRAGVRVVAARTMRAVLLAIVRNVDASTWEGSFPAMATIADRAEVSVSTARRAVRALEISGVLVTEIGGGRRSSRYKLVRPATADESKIEASSCPVNVTDDPLYVPPLFSLRSKSGRVPAASKIRKKIRRSTTIPEDLRPLADALAGRGLRAAYGLTKAQADDVRQVLARVGLPAMVSAAYRAHRANDPARFWTAWVGMWQGLHMPTAERAARPATPAGGTHIVASAETTAAGVSAARAAVNAAMARRVRVGVAA